ncbi:MAG: hypothetical protein HQL76_01805 [Magnetococcales bacterium]|nr:hypothetical protein [Magnetococcales bacterium]
MNDYVSDRLLVYKQSTWKLINLEKEGKTYWHRLVGETLKVLLEPVGIEVRVEVPVVPALPVADLSLWHLAKLLSVYGD